MDLFSLVGQFSFHLIVIIVLIFVAVYAYFKISYTYWAKKGVAYLKPTFPLGKNIVYILRFSNHCVNNSLITLTSLTNIIFNIIFDIFFVGNNVCIGFEAHSYGLETVDWYNQLKQRGLKYGGVWSFAKPVLMIIDPEYIKDILVKVSD